MNPFQALFDLPFTLGGLAGQGAATVNDIPTAAGDMAGSVLQPLVTYLQNLQNGIAGGFKAAFPSCPNGTWVGKVAVEGGFVVLIIVGVLGLVLGSGGGQTAILAGAAAA